MILNYVYCSVLSYPLTGCRHTHALIWRSQQHILPFDQAPVFLTVCAEMYRKDKPISLKSSTSSLCNNLSVFVNTEKGSLNYAVVHKYLVNIVSSTTDGSQVTNRQVVCKEPSQQGHSMIMQVPVYSVLSIPLCFSFECVGVSLGGAGIPQEA